VTCLQYLTIRWAVEGKYYRPIFVLQPVSIVILIFTRFGLWTQSLVFHGRDCGLILYWALGIALILSFILFCTTSDDEPPVYDPLFTLIGLCICILWISTFADALVALLGALCKIISISDGIIGLTILAWGNSLGDIVANVLVARSGLPEMALGACYSAPLTNLLLGIGIGFVSIIASEGTITFSISSDSPDLTNTIYFSFCFLMGQLLVTLIVVPLRGFKFPKLFGFVAILVYLVFLVLSFLIFYKVMIPDVNLWKY